MNITQLFIAVFFMFSCFGVTLEKNSLVTFLQEYDASSEKKGLKWDRLQYAIEKKYVDVAEFLVLKGDPIINYYTYLPSIPNPKMDDFNPNLPFYYVKHPLLTAIKNGHLKLAVLIITTNKESINAQEWKKHGKIGFEYKNVIRCAITECEAAYDIVFNLIAAGVEVNRGDSFGTPLMCAISSKRLDVAQLLLEHNADIEMKGAGNTAKSPLCSAVVDNYIEGVNLLLNYGADPLKGNPNACELAMQNGYCDIVDLLLDTVVNGSN